MSPKAKSGVTSQAGDGPRTRRPRGEPRRLLIEAACELFNQRGYAGATTREIADRANVSEVLIFRSFGSKPALFHAAMVQPFIEFVDAFVAARESRPSTEPDDSEALTREFVGELYDLCRSHRALAAMLFAADVHTESDLAESGVLEDVRNQLERLVSLGQDEMKTRGMSIKRQDLATRTTIAMVAGMATFGTWFFGARRPSRKAIVDELTKAVLYGHDRRE